MAVGSERQTGSFLEQDSTAVPNFAYIEIEKERESEPGRAAPAAYGRYKNVILTDTELSELQAELPDKWEYYIDRLSGYIASTGRKYKNHAATIRRWVADDTAKAAPKRGIPDYSYKEGESL